MPGCRPFFAAIEGAGQRFQDVFCRSATQNVPLDRAVEVSWATMTAVGYDVGFSELLPGADSKQRGRLPEGAPALCTLGYVQHFFRIIVSEAMQPWRRNHQW